MAQTTKSIRAWIQLQVEAVKDAIDRGDVATAQVMAQLAARSGRELLERKAPAPKPSQVNVDTRKFRAAYGHEPARTYGGWFFFANAGTANERTFEVCGRYGQAKRAAQAWAARNGFHSIEVGR